jgi:hypothetical protein
MPNPSCDIKDDECMFSTGCFRKIMTVRTRSTVAFVSSGVTTFAPISRVRFLFLICTSNQAHILKFSPFFLLLFVFSACFYMF